MKRAAQLADGYHAARTGPGDIADRIGRLRALCAKANRPLPTISVRARIRFDEAPGDVYTMCGTDAAVAAEVRQFAESGTDHLVVVLDETDPVRLVKIAERFHDVAVLAAPGS